MTTQIGTSNDVVTFLVTQHEEIKTLFREVTASTGDARQEAFTALRRLLAVHETAEEEIVHPRARREIPNGEQVISQRLEEENTAKKTLAELESLDVDSAEFETKFATFRQDVLAHAEAEETQEFARLAERLDESDLERMRRAAELAERMAPTRPHAGVESQTANMLAGPFAAMLDRSRDLLSGKS